MKRLPRSFYARKTEKVAKDLLGKILVLGECRGKIVETEAYFGPNDPASHAYRKITKRNQIMFLKPGTCYVYFTYGNHWMLNVVTEKKGVPGATLIRAVEPLEGIKIMKRRRGIKNINNLTNGPGKLTKAFGINKKHNGLDTVKDEIFIENYREKPRIHTTTRVGIKMGKNMPLRFYIKGNKFISRK